MRVGETSDSLVMHVGESADFECQHVDMSRLVLRGSWAAYAVFSHMLTPNTGGGKFGHERLQAGFNL